MKIFCLFLFLFSVSAQAAKLSGGSIVLKDGTKIYRIEVGGESKRDLVKRVRQLERAVRDLQDRVYDLETSPRQVKKEWVCEVSAFSKNFYGTASSKGKAKAKAMKSCQKKYNGMHCKLKAVRMSRLSFVMSFSKVLQTYL